MVLILFAIYSPKVLSKRIRISYKNHRSLWLFTYLLALMRRSVIFLEYAIGSSIGNP